MVRRSTSCWSSTASGTTSRRPLASTDDNSGGNTIYFSPGLRLSIDHWSGFFSVGIPVVNDLNGIQAEPDWRISTGASVAF